MIRAATVDAAAGGEFNLGTGSDISIGELAQKIIDIAGKSCELVSDDTRQRPADSEVARLCSDNRRARQVLGWQPQVTLEDGLRRVVEWYREGGSKFAWGANPT